MPEVIETTVYRLDELSDAAKDKARAWYREGGFDYDWYDAVYEDFQRVADILGLKDRGHLKAGLRADLVRFKVLGETPIIGAVWSKGERAF